MNNNQIGKRSLRWAVVIVLIVAVGSIAWGVFGQTATTPATPNPIGTTGVFTPAHASFSAAAKDFFNIRPEPVQPIAYTHKRHLDPADKDGPKIESCTYCHEGADKGAVAMIPSIKKCWECHEFTPGSTPQAQKEIQKIADYNDKNIDAPWQRVYGWSAGSHVKFNHAPHSRKSVDCVKCHGDVASMTVAQKVVNHTMNFCVSCHEQNKVSNDCMTCHY